MRLTPVARPVVCWGAAASNWGGYPQADQIGSVKTEKRGVSVMMKAASAQGHVALE